MSTYALLLNADYQPHCVLNAREAMLKILTGKAEVVERGSGDTVFRSESREIAIPAVMRLKTFVKVPYRASIPLSRAALSARDHKTCQYCFKHGDTIDHVIPRSRGGKHVWENVVLACKRCNAQKDDRLLSEIGWKLYNKPYAPKAWFWVVFKVTMDPAWEPYLPVAS